MNPIETKSLLDNLLQEVAASNMSDTVHAALCRYRAALCFQQGAYAQAVQHMPAIKTAHTPASHDLVNTLRRTSIAPDYTDYSVDRDVLLRAILETV